MNKHKVSDGVIHKTPKKLASIIFFMPNLHEAWEDITPLARNEWLCWIASAVKSETQAKRTRILCENLINGKRRPCCWAGCIHR